MFEIGASLREARSRRGLSPADVHKAVRIRERYLTALEEERWDMLPGDAYTKGFLRTYAEFLGLDGQLYVDEYNSRIALHDEEPIVPDSLARPRRVGLLGTLAGLLALGALVAGLAAWQHGGSSPGSGSPASALGAAPAAAATPAAQAPAAKPAVAPAPALASIRATRGNCWLSIRIGGASGKEIFRGTLRQGESKLLRLGTPLWVRFGNPHAVDLRVAGRAVTGLANTPENLLLSSSGWQPA